MAGETGMEWRVKKFYLLLPLVLLFSGCGTETHRHGDDLITLIGVTQVLFAGTMSETVILEVTATGEFFALAGDVARELVPVSGTEVTITGRPTEKGWSVREELQKISVVEYTVLGEPESP